MKIPKRIEPLVEDGLVDKVMRQLMSGKEAMVYVVQRGELLPDTPLSGRYRLNEKPADVHSVMREIDSARDDHAAKLRYQQLKREQGR